MSKLTHINSNGEAQMVDVSDKENTMREAKAGARVVMQSKHSRIDSLRLS